MALAFGTSPIGGHHKDAFMIAWEDTVDRRGYGVGKVDKLLELQRNRTILECFSVCRFPWLQFSLALDMYVKFFESATGIRVDLAELQNMSDRVYALIRAFWVREHGSSWSRALDRPPQRWFEGPSPRSPTKAQALDPEGYDQMLSWYYEKRGWDSQGIPTIETLNRLGLSHVASELAAPAKT
jgi:aldehyde:ferredoxin oxidoreductase